MTLAQAWVQFAAVALQANIEALHRGDSPAAAAPDLYRESWKDATLMMADMPDHVKVLLSQEQEYNEAMKRWIHLDMESI